jgi:hypothetical protein
VRFLVRDVRRASGGPWKAYCSSLNDCLSCASISFVFESAMDGGGEGFEEKQPMVGGAGWSKR